jgi:DNA-methyltransferase (dcm)
MNIATVFSGIGAVEYALKEDYPEIKTNILFACDCGECRAPLDPETVKKLHRIKDDDQRYASVAEEYAKIRTVNRVKEVYQNNYDDPNSPRIQWFDDIRFINGKPFADKVDLFVGGSPCQSFSLMGKRKGLKDTRGTLFFDYARLISEIRPRVFIFENVPGMLIHDEGRTWKTIFSVFKGLNYDVHFDVLNAKDYGIPQNRRRLFVVGFRGKDKVRPFVFPATRTSTLTMKDYLEKSPNTKYFLGKKGFQFVTNPKYAGRASIDSDIIKTEKRNQEFNWNGDFVFVPLDGNPWLSKVKNAYIGTYKGKKGAVRKLTPRECHNLMGFKNDFLLCADHDVDAYKQSGNSIVINVISAIISEIRKVEPLE